MLYWLTISPLHDNFRYEFSRNGCLSGANDQSLAKKKKSKRNCPNLKTSCRSHKFSNAWRTANAISLERDEEGTEDASVTKTGAAEDNGTEEDGVKNKPADKLLKVERGCVILRKNQRESE